MTPMPPNPEPEPAPLPSPAVDRDVGMIVLQVSATQVGICLTGVGLVRLIGQKGMVSAAADDLLAIAALGFLVTGIVAYLALRTKDAPRAHRLEQVADGLFVLCHVMMAAVGLIITYELL